MMQPSDPVTPNKDELPFGTVRIWVETLAAGQPRAYADSHLHVRVTIERFFSWLGKASDERSYWTPVNYSEEEIRQLLPLLKCGFTDKPAENWASTRLDYLKNNKPGVWEFRTTSPYTD